MRNCLFCDETSDDLINLNYETNQKPNIRTILLEYFEFYFKDDKIEGEICRSCWTELDTFHDFGMEIARRRNLRATMNQWLNNDTEDTGERSTQDDILMTKESHELVRRTFGIGLDQLLSTSKTIDESFPFKCTNCSKRYMTERRLQFHTREHNESSSPQKAIEIEQSDELTHINCEICEIRVPSDCLTDHLKLVHSVYEKKSTFECDICNKVFKTKRKQQVHRRLHTDASQICDICGHISRNRHGHNCHMGIAHRGFKKTVYHCAECNKNLKDKKTLKEHELFHSGNPLEYTCEICGKLFNFTQKIREHMRKNHREHYHPIRIAAKKVFTKK